MLFGEITDTYALDTETIPEILASTIVHKAMHARLCRWEIGYEENKRPRVEAICFRAEIAFARHLPLSEKVARKAIMSAAHRQLERDPVVWTDLGRMERYMEELQKAGCPVWLVALLRRRMLAKLRRAQDTKTG